MKDRANTSKEKAAIILRLGVLWGRNPELRLGQLINNCVENEEIYYIEDFDLIEKLEKAYEI